MAEQHLKKVLGRGFCVAACVGTIIGLGILRTPGEIAQTIQDPLLYFALWAGGGLFVLVSTVVVAELISITPRSGGPYSMVSHVFGPYPGFLLGWTDWLATCAAASLKAVVLMEYLALLDPGFRPFMVPGALLINSAFAVIQLAGVRVGGRVFQVASACFALILVGFSLALLFGHAPAADPGAASNVIHTAPTWAHYGIVVAGVVFTYDGWVGASYYTGEVVGGGRAAALGSVRGVLLVIGLYLLLNGLLVANVPLTALQGSELALAGALDFLYGPGSGTFVVLAALFILTAHQNVQYMAASRVLYALSVDGLGTRRATGVSEKGSPTGAVLLSWALMSALIVVGGFEFLLNMCALLFMAGYVAMVLGVFRMRRRAPDLQRPYSAWGFPATGLVCLAGWIVIATFVGIMDLKSSAWSLGLAAVSVPVYLWLRSRRAAAQPARAA